MNKRTHNNPSGRERAGKGRNNQRPASSGRPARSGGRPDRRREGDEDERTGQGRPRAARDRGTRSSGPARRESASVRPWQKERGESPAPEGKGRPGSAGGPQPRRGASGPRKVWDKPRSGERPYKEGDLQARRPFRKGERSNRFSLPNPANEGLIRLNKYLAQAGVGSRRDADLMITSGAVTVNGKVVTELGTKVKPEDVVHFGSQKLRMEQKRYVLLNKPKDTITTTDDPQERHTVMSLIAKACTERLYPVGRLDRNTTGVLLLTNDGDLAKKLTHPSHGAQKMYHATLDRSLTVEQLHKLVDGLELEDGPARADEVSFVGESKREVGIAIHMGRNRIVRRMFEALGTEVVKLDRVMFAGLTKKDLPRGHWRHLEEKEVTWLKQMKDAPKGGKEARGGRRTRLSQGSE
ncbi:MAG: RNA-binding S4 domain-containing protein [Bacteroidetes bacterium]|nr:RNA-binding S4 domain-containing protein [Bacteroidota bacterium]